MKIKDYLSKIGRKGGTNRMALLTKAQKRDLAMKAVQAKKAIKDIETSNHGQSRKK